jgi:hypothetical protein
MTVAVAVIGIRMIDPLEKRMQQPRQRWQVMSRVELARLQHEAGAR